MRTPADNEFRQQLKAHLLRFSALDPRRATCELATTLLAYGLLLVLTRECLARAGFSTAGQLGWALAGLAAVAGLALVQVRTFLVHHDLCHFAVFRSHRLNLAVARVVGTLVSTSTSVWKREHDRHHRDSNNLDRSQDGQTASWTVAQYEGAKPLHRRLYWFLNQRVVLFGVLPPLYFLGFMRVLATWYENLLFAGLLAVLWSTHTLTAFAAALLPATVFGFLVFHAQHTGPRLVRRRADAYDVIENGLRGSTLLVLPELPLVGRCLRWALFGVEFHHVHHLHPSMPAWRQRACHDAGAAFFATVPRLTLGEALRATELTLYDEAIERLVPFPKP
jgi:acyl-lipid omega-6 desaturase (Delta-12 desaturase)